MPVESMDQIQGGALPSNHDNTATQQVDRTTQSDSDKINSYHEEHSLPKRSDDSIPHMVGGEMSATTFQFQINNAYGMELDGVIHREYENIVEDI